MMPTLSKVALALFLASIVVGGTLVTLGYEKGWAVVIIGGFVGCVIDPTTDWSR